jgi:hypothetical protein
MDYSKEEQALPQLVMEIRIHQCHLNLKRVGSTGIRRISNPGAIQRRVVICHSWQL